MTPIYQRIQEAFGTTNGAEIGRKLGFEKQTVYGWRDGRSLPTTETIIKIYECTGISLHWLLTGEGVKFIIKPEQTDSERLAMVSNPANTKTDILLTGAGLPTNQHQLVLLPLLGLISGFRIVERRASAVSLVPKSLLAEDSVAFQVEGDALANEGLHDGDLILARPAPNDLPDGLVIVQISDQVFIRQLTKQSGLALLSPVNGSQPAIRVPLAQLKVLWLVTSLTRNFFAAVINKRPALSKLAFVYSVAVVFFFRPLGFSAGFPFNLRPRFRAPWRRRSAGGIGAGNPACSCTITSMM